MRWLVEVTPLGNSAETESVQVEGDTWYTALVTVRAGRGETGGLGGFSIELLDNGCRAVDPASHLRYRVTALVGSFAGAEEDRTATPAESLEPDGPPVQTAGLPSRTPTSLPPRPTEQGPSGTRSMRPAVLVAPDPGDAPAATGAGPGMPASQIPPGADATVVASQLIFKREQDRTPSQPLTYREYVYLVPLGTTNVAAERLLQAQLALVRSSLAHIPLGKLVNLAAFDVHFKGRSPVAPLATLTWKDWHGTAVVSFPRARSIAPAALANVSNGLAPSTIDSIVAEATPLRAVPEAVNGVDERPRGGVDDEGWGHPSPVPAFPPPRPVPAIVPVSPPAEDLDPSVVALRPPAAAPPAPHPEPGIVEEQPEGPVTAPVAASVPAPVAASVPAPVAASVPAPVAASVPAPVAASVPAPVAASVPAPVAASVPAPVMAPVPAPVMAPVTASVAASVPPPVAFPVAAPADPPSVPRARVRGEDLIADLFEAMHDLHFLQDAVEAGSFCLALSMSKIPCRAGIVHSYDIDRRQFLVTTTRGAPAAPLLLRRYPERDLALYAATRKRRAIILSYSTEAEAQSLERYAAIGGVRRVLVAPAMLVGRFLGAIELVDPLDGQPFTDSDAYAMTYIAEQFAQFVAEHGIVTDPERIRR
jgi:hypothetical protein